MIPAWRIPFLSCLLVSVALCGCTEQPASRARVYSYGLIKPAVGSLGVHSFRKGDTLWSIANTYQVDLRDMLDLNNLSVPYAVKVGQRIRLPAPTNYTTRKGDTLYKVSRMFETTTTELVRLNALRAPYRLKDGQILRLPSKHGRPAQQIASKNISNSVESEELSSSPVSGGLIDREELPPVASQEKETLDKNTKPDEANKKQAQSLIASGQGFMKPVPGKIISGFGAKADGLHNDGINIKAMKGDAVRSAENGEVVYAGNQIDGYGNLVLVRHPNGYMTAYAHMDKILVQKGAKVGRGETIGTVGKTGNVSTPQLHFEIRKGREAMNPQKYLG